MAFLSGLEHFVRANEALAPYLWLRIGGPSEYFAEPTHVDDLSRLVERCAEEDMPIRMLGGGSNILARSEGVPGVVIHGSAAAFAEIRVEGQEVVAGGGAKLSHLVSTCVGDGLGGLESLVGIPGTVGGALHGNAGAEGTDIGQCCVEATVMTRTGKILTRTADDLRFSYRKSSLDELVILSARLRLEQEDPAELARRMQKVWIVRRSHQPAREWGTGCVFKDPQGSLAADIIEQVGLKGTRVGGVEVSDVNANFITVGQGATSDDVRRLIDLIRGRVTESLGMDLEVQLEIW